VLTQILNNGTTTTFEEFQIILNEIKTIEVLVNVKRISTKMCTKKKKKNGHIASLNIIFIFIYFKSNIGNLDK